VPVVIGTSGWQYRHWRGRLYPAGLPQARWLEHYAERLAAVEVNATFYRLPAPSTFAAWRRRTPEGFVIAVKASRYITHVRRLRDSDDAVARLMEATSELGPRLGPILLQLPPNLPRDLPRLEATLAAFPAGVRVTVEPRHDSWLEPETMELLERHDAALCMADRPGWRPEPRRTASWGYVRFHEGRASPRPCYGERALDTWATRLAELFSPDETVYAFFNNDPEGCAPRDARVFARKVARADLSPTRVPKASETPVGARGRR